jgi:hypothetical protein
VFSFFAVQQGASFRAYDRVKCLAETHFQFYRQLSFDKAQEFNVSALIKRAYLSPSIN